MSLVYWPGFGAFPWNWASNVRFQGQADPRLLARELGEIRSCFPCGKCGKHRPTDDHACPHCGAYSGWAKCGGRECRSEDLGPAVLKPMKDSYADNVPANVRAARKALLACLGIKWPTKLPSWYFGDGITSESVQRWIDGGRSSEFEDDGNGWDALEVLVSDDPKFDKIAKKIPRSIGGVRVFVRRSSPIVALSDVEGRAYDDSTTQSHNWTGTRGGWYDYSGPTPAPGALDGMKNSIMVPTDIDGETLNTLIGIDRVVAEGGNYVRMGGGDWIFVIDPVARIKVGIRTGKMPPKFLPANKLICWKDVPSKPMIGGFVHPNYNFYCRTAAIPWSWDPAKIEIVGGLADDTDPKLLAKAEIVAAEVNKALSSRPWWLYTLPKVEDDAPTVVIGVKGDVPFPSPQEMAATQWNEWRKNVKIKLDVVQPNPGMGSAPIDEVWPTSSPDWREPIGPGTGDDDPAMGARNYEFWSRQPVYGNSKSRCPICGRPPVGATRCSPGEYFCAAGHHWERPDEVVGPDGSFVMVKKRKPLECFKPIGDPYQDDVYEEVGPMQFDEGPGAGDDDPSSMGQTSHGFPARWRAPAVYGDPGARERRMIIQEAVRVQPIDMNMGSAPVVAMPTGMLNWDRVSGYEGQNWTIHDPPTWAPKEAFLSDAASDQKAAIDSLAAKLAQTKRPPISPLKAAFAGAAVGAAAGIGLRPDGTSTATSAAVGAVVVGLGAFLTARFMAGAADAITSAASKTQA